MASELAVKLSLVKRAERKVALRFPEKRQEEIKTLESEAEEGRKNMAQMKVAGWGFEWHHDDKTQETSRNHTGPAWVDTHILRLSFFFSFF